MPFWIGRTFIHNRCFLFIIRSIKKLNVLKTIGCTFDLFSLYKPNERMKACKYSSINFSCTFPDAQLLSVCNRCWCLPCDTMRKRKCIVPHTWTCINRMNHIFFCYYTYQLLRQTNKQFKGRQNDDFKFLIFWLLANTTKDRLFSR